MTSLSELIKEYGDDKVKFQVMDASFISAKRKKEHNEITFGTNAGFGINGLDEMCFIIFMDRAKVKQIMDSKKWQYMIKT